VPLSAADWAQVRPAARDLAGLQVVDKEAALRSLATLATGVWSGHDVKHLSGQSIPSELSLYESKFGKGARIIWTVGIDFVPMVGLYQQTIRVWAVDRSHDDAQRSIQRVCAIHRRGLTSVLNRRLKTRVQVTCTPRRPTCLGCERSPRRPHSLVHSESRGRTSCSQNHTKWRPRGLSRWRRSRRRSSAASSDLALRGRLWRLQASSRASRAALSLLTWLLTRRSTRYMKTLEDL